MSGVLEAAAHRAAKARFVLNLRAGGAILHRDVRPFEGGGVPIAKHSARDGYALRLVRSQRVAHVGSTRAGISAPLRAKMWQRVWQRHAFLPPHRCRKPLDGSGIAGLALDVSSGMKRRSILGTRTGEVRCSTLTVLTGLCEQARSKLSGATCGKCLRSERGALVGSRLSTVWLGRTIVAERRR
jgi:hypothetical protein